MRTRAVLDDLVTGVTSVRVLRVLSLHPRRRFTGREFARLAGGAPSKVIAELRRLEGFGLVTRRTVGRSHEWRANRKNVLLQMVRHLFEKERGLRERVLSELKEASSDPAISRAIVFGSFARGDDTAESDVDFLVFTRRMRDVEPTKERLAALHFDMHHEFGIRLSPIVHAESDLPRFRRTGLYRSVRTEGVQIRGASI